MKIILARHFGLCFGVRDAIAQAEEFAQQGPLTILGELVHNNVVHEQLRERGVQQGSLDDSQSASRRVMITAHGASDVQRSKWRNAGYEVADATCPLVRHAHQELKQLVAAGYHPVVIGRSGHVEVRGLTEDFPGATVVEQHSELAGVPARLRYGVISQTTQPIDFVRQLVGAIRERFPGSEVLFVDTVCRPTKERQLALGDLIAKAETIVVVGGQHSNNTRQLVQTCRLAGRRAIHVERPEDLNPADFCEVQVVGLTAGTSTLPETVTAVWQRLNEMSSDPDKTKRS
ncbi:MAG: 4-hydroxy-3-methylbut-2-enyl diphosphate reductase [Chthoniobacterales bacterium]